MAGDQHMNTCDVCGFELWNPVTDLSASYVSLYDDARFPGRCIVALNTHAETIEDLSLEEANAFMADVYRVARSIKEVTNVERVNIAILGNTVPHIHAHVIPRYPENEPLPHKSIWDDTRKKTLLDENTKDEIISKLRTSLSL